MSKKDPAILFYTSDFLTGTSFMSNEQSGIYIKLLCLQHQHGGMLDKDFFNNIVGHHNVIRNKFIECEEGFYNNRMLNEMVKRQKKSKSLSENALKRWKKHKNKQCKSNANAYNLHMPIENINENENINKYKDIKDIKFIKITIEEYNKLINNYSKTTIREYIEKLENYIGSKGKRYKNHYYTILSWLRKDNIKPNNQKPAGNDAKSIVEKYTRRD